MSRSLEGTPDALACAVQGCAGSVLDLTPMEIEVGFSGGSSPRLPIGEPCVFELSGGGLRRPLALTGRLVYRREDVDTAVLRFQVAAEARMAVGNLVNRREAFRVAPIVERPVAVRMAVPGAESVEGVLKDLSRTGLSVLVRAEEESLLQDVKRLGITFRLPDFHEPFEFDGIVRYRALAGSAVRYGIEYQVADPALEERLEKELGPYVLRCQAELLIRLRRAADRLDAA